VKPVQKILKQLKKRGKTPGINCSDALMLKEELLISNGHFIHVFTGCCYSPPVFEINEKNEIMHYSPYNGEVLPGYMYTDNGFWDTFRAVSRFLPSCIPR